MTAPLLVFDLDTTLYSKELPVRRMVDDRIEFMEYTANTSGKESAS